jgi:GNAT superfamily N-acetyltransferase
MTVIDLPSEQESLYCQCLEDWSPEMKEAGPVKRRWFHRMKERGLRVKVCLDETATIGGMIHYGPIENVPIEGSGLFYVYCVWVHGYQEGRGDFRHRGMGKALLKAAEDDARQRGAKGLVVWGLSIPVFMRASWFRKQGYRVADRSGAMQLLWKPFVEDAAPPAWPKKRRKPDLQEGKVVVTALVNGWCPAQGLVYERARRVAAEFPERVVFREVDTFERQVGLAWGTSDALFVDGRQVRTGPPPSYEKIRKLVQKRVRRLEA